MSGSPIALAACAAIIVCDQAVKFGAVPWLVGVILVAVIAFVTVRKITRRAQ